MIPSGARLNLGCVALGALLAAAASGCSTAQTSGSDDASKYPNASGPTVVYVRPEPGVVDLNRDFEPTRPAQVLADVKDFTSKISEVKLRFIGVPLEIPMENIGGSTWRARLTPTQLELLAVSGQTVHYAANVVVRDEQGKTGKTLIPVDVAIRAPEIASAGAGRPAGPGAGAG